jgi:AcrR family transcriptional regulator
MRSKSSILGDKIVSAAALLFAQQGYRGTSTREIARLAEVSENTLFRHFEHKEDIFWSALRSRAVALTPRSDLVERIRSEGAPDVVLPKILEMLSDTVNYRPEVLRLMAVAVLELPGKAEVLCRELISPLFSEINQYLAASVKKGNVKEVDPTLLTASLIAMVLIHPQILKLTDGNSSSIPERRDSAQVYSKFWLNVLSTGSSIPAASKPVCTEQGSIS